MSEQEAEDVAADDPEGAAAGVSSLLYKVALAGVGGVMLAQEEIARVLRPRKEPREPSEEGAPLDEAADGSAGADDDADHDAEREERFDVAIDRVLRTLKLPSRSDVDELGRAVAALERRGARLQGERGDG